MKSSLLWMIYQFFCFTQYSYQLFNIAFDAVKGVILCLIDIEAAGAIELNKPNKE